MPGTTSTALLSFSHDQHHETNASKRKGGELKERRINIIKEQMITLSHKLFHNFVTRGNAMLLEYNTRMCKIVSAVGKDSNINIPDILSRLE